MSKNLENSSTVNAIDALAATHLGKKGGEGYKDTYDPSLLVAIPRYLNREAYGIEETNLPFVGVDVWNAYEVSALTNKGLPVTGMMKIVYNSSSKFHVESKSIKLYLNSFNMTRLGDTQEECIRLLENKITVDLTTLLQTDVQVSMFLSKEGYEGTFTGFETLEYTLPDINNLVFDSYKSDKDKLSHHGELEIEKTFYIHTGLLRSNCRVTSQPDWGDIYITIKTKYNINKESILRYIISHRQVNHFHEEICEMVYKHLLDKFDPSGLMVSCLYTRRGGIDINPIRASHANYIPMWYTSGNTRIGKTLRQ